MDSRTAPSRWLPAVRGGLALGCAAVLALATTASPAGASRVRFHRTDKRHQTIVISRTKTALADSQSSNWSGYNQGILDTDTPVSSVSGQWVVPTATQHTKGDAEDSATWIGIGGGCLNSSCTATDETLIQAGTEQSVAANGQATYDAWYEIIPVPEEESTIAVHPGDVIDCTISATVPGDWTISLQDTTDGQGFTQTIPYPSDESTAEWIEETPTEIGTSDVGVSSLPDLTTVHFTDATVNGADANLQAGQAIQLTDASGDVIATPSAPDDGGAFDDCAYATSCPTP